MGVDFSRFFKLGVHPSSNRLLDSRGKRLARVAQPSPPTVMVLVGYLQPYHPT